MPPLQPKFLSVTIFQKKKKKVYSFTRLGTEILPKNSFQGNATSLSIVVSQNKTEMCFLVQD
jgi:hypothetical protein